MYVCETSLNQSKSATRSFNILKKFTRISANNLGELKNIINDPSNGVLLILHLRESFDELVWCLQPTAVSLSLEDRGQFDNDVRWTMNTTLYSMTRRLVC